MARILEFTVPAESFPLGRLFRDLPDATVELERVVPTAGDLFPYFWVEGTDNEAVEEALAERDPVGSLTLVDDVDGGLFRVTWDPSVDGLIDILAEHPVTLLSAVGTAEQWRFEVRGDDAGRLTAFLGACRDHDPPIPVEVGRVRSLTDVSTQGGYDLTPEQREALLLAFDEGYFNEPRDVKLEELAAMLGISRPSLSSRLRRGFRNLVGTTIAER